MTSDTVCGCGHRCRKAVEQISLAKVIGRNARGLRTASDLTLEQVALAMKVRGFPWSSGRVGDLESGRIPPNLTLLLCLIEVLNELTGTDSTLSDLLHGETQVIVNEHTTMPLADIRLKLGIK